MQASSFQTSATLVCKNEKAEEIALLRLLMKVAVVLIVRPKERDDLVGNFLVRHLASPRLCDLASAIFSLKARLRIAPALRLK